MDVGAKMWSTGSIVRVKLLGVLAMIDDGETDWKLIAINAEDPAAELLNDIDDLAVHMPGASEALHRWLKYYKTPTINRFAFDGQAQPRSFAETVLEECHQQWQKLIADTTKAASAPEGSAGGSGVGAGGGLSGKTSKLKVNRSSLNLAALGGGGGGGGGGHAGE